MPDNAQGLGDTMEALEPIGPLVEEETGELIFTGWWSDDEKPQCSKPWEVFSLQLFGREAGDWIEEWETVKARLRDRGVKLVWTETGKDVA